MLNIDTSSGMPGSTRFEQLALDIKDAARDKRIDSVRSFLAVVELCGQVTFAQLHRVLLSGRLPDQGQMVH